jgi:penicillin-binding protein 1A
LAPSRHPRDAEARTRVVLCGRWSTTACSMPALRAALAMPRALQEEEELPVGSYFARLISPQAKDAFATAYGEVSVPHDARLRPARAGAGHDRAAAWRKRRGEPRGQVALVAMRPELGSGGDGRGRDYAASPY